MVGPFPPMLGRIKFQSSPTDFVWVARRSIVGDSPPLAVETVVVTVTIAGISFLPEA